VASLGRCSSRTSGVRGEVDLAVRLDHIENNWTDAQPTSLRERVTAGQAFVM
jgi:hypothetical protein